MLKEWLQPLSDVAGLLSAESSAPRCTLRSRFAAHRVSSNAFWQMNVCAHVSKWTMKIFHFAKDRTNVFRRFSAWQVDREFGVFLAVFSKLF